MNTLRHAWYLLSRFASHKWFSYADISAMFGVYVIVNEFDIHRVWVLFITAVATFAFAQPELFTILVRNVMLTIFRSGK